MAFVKLPYHATGLVTLGDGTKMTILRNATGRFDGFIFPDGSKAIFLWKKAPDFDFSLPAGLKFISPSGKETVFPLTGSPKQKDSASLSKITFLVDDAGDCQFAVAAAAAAAVNAAIACGSGNPTCVTATVIAAVAVTNAVRVCRRINPDEESPVV